MATILEFRRAAGPTPRVTELKDGVLGQIIIFPGVRIERQVWEDSPERTTHRASGHSAAGRSNARSRFRSRPLARSGRTLTS